MSIKLGNYVKDRSRAAKWLYERHDRVMWWNWAVLTKHNPDKETLGLPDVIAYQIFTDLAERDLLLPTVRENGVEAYRLNLGLDAEWQKVIKPPGIFRRYVLPVISLAFRNAWTFVIWLASVIIAAWIGSLFKK